MEEAEGSSKAPTSNHYCSIVVLLGDGLATLSFTSLWQHSGLGCVINFYFQQFFMQCFPVDGAVHCCFPAGVH